MERRASPLVTPAGRGRPALHHQVLDLDRWRVECLDRPARVFRDYRVRIFAESFQGRHKFLVTTVPHRHHCIAPQAGKLGAPDWRSAKHVPELFLLHFGQPVECRIDEPIPRLELRGGSRRRLAVPWANVLTDVASEDVPSDARAQVVWNLTPLLNSQ